MTLITRNLEQIRRVERVDKVNVVCLTDGESNPLSQLVEHDGDEYYYRSKGEISVRSLYRGRRMKYILRDKKSGYSRELNPSQFITTQEIVSFYREITDYNWVGIRIWETDTVQGLTGRKRRRDEKGRFVKDDD